MHSKQYLLIAIGFFCASIFSCKKKEEYVNPTSNNISESTDYKVSPDGKIKLGKKLENPYAIDVMQTAYNHLKKSSRASEVEESPVKLTHYYVRFLPKDWTEYDKLKLDSTLNLYEVPLDYSVELHGNSYHDPSIPADKPTWQYTSVSKDYIFPSIKYEILSNLYIPESDSTLNESISNSTRNGRPKKSFKDALIDEAMMITKNYDDTLKPKAINARYNPVGIITVFDTRLGRQIPLVGVKVRARRWFTYSTTTTNGDGWFQNVSFNRDVNYALFFETSDFDVRNGTFGQAWIDGPHSSSPWLLNIGNDANGFYAHVFRGAYRYHYGNIGGLVRPFFGFKLKYAAFDKTKSYQGMNIGNWSLFTTNPNILIYWATEAGGRYGSDEVFSTTIHETCHSTHAFIMNGSYIQYLQVSTSIQESWPVAVEWFITQMDYRERGIANYATGTYNVEASYPIRFGYQYWPFNSSANYSSVFIDVVDDFNQLGTLFRLTNGVFYTSTVNDQVFGYSLATIERKFLKHVYGIGSLRKELKENKPAGVTDEQVDLLLNNF